MTRADLLKVFDIEGGLQGIPPEVYVLRSCWLIKVRVDFELPKGVSRQDLAQRRDLAWVWGKESPMNSQIKLLTISKPYLERMNMD